MKSLKCQKERKKEPSMNLLQLPDDALILILCHMITDNNHCNVNMNKQPQWWSFALSCTYLYQLVINFFQRNNLDHPSNYGRTTCPDCNWDVNELYFNRPKFMNSSYFNIRIPRLCETLTSQMVRSVVKYCPQIKNIHFESGCYISHTIISEISSLQLTGLQIEECVEESIAEQLICLPSCLNNIVLNGLIPEYTPHLMEFMEQTERSFESVEFNYSVSDGMGIEKYRPFHHLRFELFTPVNTTYSKIKLKSDIRTMSLSIMKLNGSQMLKVTLIAHAFKSKIKFSETACTMCNGLLEDEIKQATCIHCDDDFGSKCTDIVITVDLPRFSNSLRKILQVICKEYDVIVRGGLYCEPFTLYAPTLSQDDPIMDCKLLHASSGLISEDSPLMTLVDTSCTRILSVDMEQARSDCGQNLTSEFEHNVDDNFMATYNHSDNNNEQCDIDSFKMPSLEMLQLKSVTDEFNNSYHIDFQHVLNLSSKFEQVTKLEVTTNSLYSVGTRGDIDELFRNLMNLEQIHVLGNVNVVDNVDCNLVDDDSDTFLQLVPKILKCFHNYCKRLRVVQFHLQVDDYGNNNIDKIDEKKTSLLEAQIACFNFTDKHEMLEGIDFLWCLNSADSGRWLSSS